MAQQKNILIGSVIPQTGQPKQGRDCAKQERRVSCCRFWKSLHRLRQDGQGPAGGCRVELLQTRGPGGGKPRFMPDFLCGCRVGLFRIRKLTQRELPPS